MNNGNLGVALEKEITELKNKLSKISELCLNT